MSEQDIIPPSPQHRDAEVVQHVLREVGAGRPFHDVMEDSYVVDRLDEGSHDRVLDHPEVTEAVGAEIIAELRRLLDN